MIVGYARVSTDGQALDAQQTALQSRRGRLVDQSAKPPSAKARKPVSALPPQMPLMAAVHKNLGAGRAGLLVFLDLLLLLGGRPLFGRGLKLHRVCCFGL